MSTRTLTESHKEALVQGRREARIVRSFLATLRDDRKARNRAEFKERLADLTSRLNETEDALERLMLIKERQDLVDRFDADEDDPEKEEAEDQFVQVAAEYSERKGIPRSAWEEIGVPGEILDRAGM